MQWRSIFPLAGSIYWVDASAYLEMEARLQPNCHAMAPVPYPRRVKHYSIAARTSLDIKVVLSQK